jgi:hypothetical protein
MVSAIPRAAHWDELERRTSAQRSEHPPDEEKVWGNTGAYVGT